MIESISLIITLFSLFADTFSTLFPFPGPTSEFLSFKFLNLISDYFIQKLASELI